MPTAADWIASLIIGCLIGGAVWFTFMRLVGGKPAKKQVKRIAIEHRDVLGVKWLQTVRIDEYGNPNYDKWWPEINYFIDTVVAPRLSWFQRRWLLTRGRQKSQIIAGEVARARCAEIEAAGPGLTPTDPLAYETFIATALRKLDWDARVTGRSGDQGTDVIAAKRGVRVVLQCKLYNQPVGNAAVQEIYGGKAFHRADRAVVVSNATFTSAARDLAASTGVLLLHDTQLGELDRLCGIGEAERIA